MDVRRRLQIRPEHSLAYGPRAEATDIWMDALSGSVMIRLQSLNSEGQLVREMHIELTPERARTVAAVLQTKARMAAAER